MMKNLSIESNIQMVARFGAAREQLQNDVTVS